MPRTSLRLAGLGQGWLCAPAGTASPAPLARMFPLLPLSGQRKKWEHFWAGRAVCAGAARETGGSRWEQYLTVGPLQGSGRLGEANVRSPEVLPLTVKAAHPIPKRSRALLLPSKSDRGRKPRRQRSRAADSVKLGNFLFPSLAERADCTIGRWALNAPAPSTFFIERTIGYESQHEKPASIWEVFRSVRYAL